MNMLKNGLFGLFVIFLLYPVSFVQAAEENKIQSIDIEVELHPDASATIHEKRVMESYEDTEVYIELSNLGPSELRDFQVAGFEELEPWDVDASFEEKANKYGVILLDEGYELAWGISDYGQKDYDVTYELSNMVRELEDGQSLFWNFDSFLSLPTDRMTLTIDATEFPLDEKILEVYTFGAEGTYDRNDVGAFEWTADNLDEMNDVIVLLQFPKGTFQSQTQVNQTLIEQKELALEGSSYNEDSPMPMAVKVLLGISGLTILGASGFGLTYANQKRKIRKEQKHFNPQSFKKQLKKSISKKAPILEAPYENYSWFIKRLSLGGGGFSEYFFLYLLKWAEEGRIKIQSKEEKGFFGSQKKAEIEIMNFLEEEAVNILSFEEYVELFELGESLFEELIWGMLLELADEAGKVRGKEIEAWSEEHADSVDEMVKLLEERSLVWLETHNYLNTFTVQVWGSDLKIEQLTDKGVKLVTEIISYQNFINQLEEVSLQAYEDWEELMQWAILLGVAEEKVQELKDLDPVRWAELEMTYPYYYGNYFGYYYLYRQSSSGLASGGYSGLSGGSSSMGGGMGAGGGGGGGTR